MLEVRTEEYNGHHIAISHHDTGSNRLVVFCHGFRGTDVGPSRSFVRAARRLEAAGISSVRFDQFGSGNSEGEFSESRFDDWVETTQSITKDYLARGHQVALLGQSMGGATVISVGATLSEVAAVVAWVPDPNIDEFSWPEGDVVEEGGQTVHAAYWQQAHDARVAERLASLDMPVLVFQCTEDEYVDESNRQAIESNALAHHEVVTLRGHKHSDWTYGQVEDVIGRSADFIVKAFERQHP